MTSQKDIKNFSKIINRQRIKPKIWDYSYLLLKNNKRVFSIFRELALEERKTKILDVGCGFKPWLAMFKDSQIEYIGVDSDEEKTSADFVASADNLPFSDNSFDALIYSEVLEHVVNLGMALKEMRRVAKDGALIFISSPFMFPEHGIPFDFQRLTQYFYREIFKNDEIIIIKESNSSLSTALVSFNLFVESSPFRIFKGIKTILYVFVNVLSMMIDRITDFIFSYIGKSYKKYFNLMPLGYCLIIRIKK